MLGISIERQHTGNVCKLAEVHRAWHYSLLFHYFVDLSG